MKRKRAWIMAIGALAALAGGLAVAQLIEPDPSPASLFPEGALVYAEARDLKQLLTWWANSETRGSWLQTSNHAEFENSRLYQRLDERLRELTKGQFAFTLESVTGFAGSRSALALYDIGELKAVAVTRIGFSEVTASELWADRSLLRKKKVGNQNYYVEPVEGRLAFAFASPYLVVASEEALLLEVVKAIRDPQTTGRLTETGKWKQMATRQQAGGFFTLFLDQENLNTNRYFRNYWIHQNGKDLESIQAAWIDLDAQDGAIVEHRYYLRNDSPGSPLENVADYLKPFEAVHHENLVLTPNPKPEEVAARLLQAFHRLPGGQPAAGAPPVYSAAAERLSKAEARSAYLAQIDEPIVVPAAEKLLRLDQQEKLQQILAPASPVVELRFTYPLWDDRALFVQFPQTMIVQLNQFGSLNQQEFLNVTLDYFRTLHSTQDQGARWILRDDGSYRLDSLFPVHVRFQDPWLVVSTRDQEFQQAVQALPPSATSPHTFYQKYELDRARWKYSRLMKRLDTGAYSGDAPLFFSDNLESLIQTSRPIRRVSILRNSDEEILRYELK